MMILVFFIFSFHVFADDSGWDTPDLNLTVDSGPLYVSLGSHCETAVFLKENHLRRVAFPFDWLLTLDHHRFVEALYDDFGHFLDEEFLFQHPKFNYIIENRYYEIEFRHDWPYRDLWVDAIRSEMQLEEIRTKYERRISRFRKLRFYPGKVVFIRVAFDFNIDTNPFWGNERNARIDEFDAQVLKMALDQYFPELDFLLILVNYQEENVPRIKAIDGVLEFKIRKTQKHEDYQFLFSTVAGLL